MRQKFQYTLLISLVFGLSSLTTFAKSFDYVVAQDGSGDFISIQKAIDACKAFPKGRVSIFVKNGVYKEKVVVPSCNSQLSIIGESIEKTVISYDDYFGKIDRGRNSTFYTYTLKVEANDFRMENITIENTAGGVGQAVALHVEGDRCLFLNCCVNGNQDSLYAAGEGSRQYFKNCIIEGTTDFIFGEATAVFEDCSILSKKNAYITAASTPKWIEFGFVFLNCKIKADSGADKVYLGRPWRTFAKVVFLRCEMGNHIRPEGWHNWSKSDSENTVLFAEYKSTGAGENNGARVRWSKQLKACEAKKYTIENILHYSTWNIN